MKGYQGPSEILLCTKGKAGGTLPTSPTVIDSVLPPYYACTEDRAHLCAIALDVHAGQESRSKY